MTKEENHYRYEAIQTLGWIFGWWRCGRKYVVPNGFEVHHLDRNPFNNSLDNLQVLTIEEHRKVHEKTRREILAQYRKINGMKNSKKVLCIETGIIYESIGEASRQTNANRCHIRDVCNGKRKTTNSYHWKYIDK